MTSRCSVLSLLGLCEKDWSIIMLIFNKLRSIVYEIFDNSQLFLTDPRKVNVTKSVMYSVQGICTTIAFFEYENHTSSVSKAMTKVKILKSVSNLKMKVAATTQLVRKTR